MNIDDRIDELEKQKSKTKILNVLNFVAGIGLCITLFLVAFKYDRVLSVCLIFCIVPNFFYFLKSYRVRIEDRLLRELKQISQP